MIYIKNYQKNMDLMEQIDRLKNTQNQILDALGNGELGLGPKSKNSGSELINNLLHNSSIENKIENIQNLFNKAKENIENDFKKEKEYYLKDQANKVESISHLKEINKKLDMDNEAARKTTK